MTKEQRDNLRATIATQIACSEMHRTDDQFGNGYIRFAPELEGCHEKDAEYCVAVADRLLDALDKKEAA